MKKATFSKYLVFAVLGACVLLTLYTLIFMPVMGDLTPLAYLIPAWFTALSVALGYYFNKAKAENTRGGIVYDAAMNDEGGIG